MNGEEAGRELDPLPFASVLLIHGTAAGTADARKPQWWQSESPFAQEFAKKLGVGTQLAEPFLWGEGGANSEVARRTGGENLYARLQEMEQSGTPYHVVAHSHGGSVVWHALAHSARLGRRLAHLRGWTTVGTPFLAFEPDPMALWQAAGFASTSASLVWLYASIGTFITERSVIFSEGNASAVAGTIALWLALVAFFVFFAGRLVLLASQFLARRASKAAERRAASWYGDLWLGLWHERDEPICGLQATLSDAPEIVPRLGKARRSAILRLLLTPYDVLFAPVGDTFAWSAVMGKVQGSDEIGRVMTAAGPAPAVLAPGWPPLFSDLSSSLRKSADERAGVSAGRLRDALAHAAKESSGQAGMIELAKVIGWDELIHTSYFNDPKLLSVIVAKTMNRPMPAFVPEEFRPARPANDTGPRLRRRPLAQAVASAVFVVVLVAVLGFASLAAYRGAIEPLTDRYQLAAIAKVFGQKSVMGATKGRAAGLLLARLIAADAPPSTSSEKGYANQISREIYGAVDELPLHEQRFKALQIVFFLLGASGQDEALTALLQDLKLALDGTEDDLFEGVLADRAELGYATAGRKPPDELTRIADRIEQLPDQSDRLRFSAEVVLPRLIRNKRDDDARALALALKISAIRKEAPDGCVRGIAPLVAAFARAGEADAAIQLAASCSTEEDRYRLTLEAISQLAQRGGQGSVAKASELLRAIESEKPLLASEAVIWRYDGIARLLVAAGRIADAKQWLRLHLKDASIPGLDDYNRGVYRDAEIAAGEMLRMGHKTDAREVFDDIVAAMQAALPESANLSQKITVEGDKVAFDVKTGSMTREQLAAQAEGILDSAAAAERPFEVAADAARAAALYEQAGQPDDVREALKLAIRDLPHLQPPSDRREIVAEVARMAGYLDLNLAESFADAAIAVADSEGEVAGRDKVLAVVPDVLARKSSLNAGRGIADKIVGAEDLLNGYATLVGVYLEKVGKPVFPATLEIVELYPPLPSKVK